MMATVGVSLLERQQRYKDAVARLEQLLGEAALSYFTFGVYLQPRFSEGWHTLKQTWIVVQICRWAVLPQPAWRVVDSPVY